MTYTLTRLLNEIKVSDNKISKKLSERVSFVDIMVAGKLKNSKSETDLKQTVDSHIQAIDALIKHRDKCRSKLLHANNTTLVKIGDLSITIAEAIAMKSTINQKMSLLNSIERDIVASKEKVISYEAQAESKLDDLIRASIGKDKKTDATEIESISKIFRDNNKVSLSDPAGIEKYLKDEKEKVEEFISNIDFALSEVNAKTEVVID